MQPDLEAAFARLDISALKQSLPQYQLLVAAITRRYGLMSARLATLQYESARQAAGVTSKFTVAPQLPPLVAQVGQAVDWATQPLWAAQPDIETTKTNVTGAVNNLVLDAGRQTIIKNVHADPKAKGWARIPEPTACYFCALLATRGDVYKSEKAADFKSHDHCKCHAEPIFNAYEPSAQIRQWQQQYADATRDARGMKAKQLAWRHAFENQPS